MIQGNMQAPKILEINCHLLVPLVLKLFKNKQKICTLKTENNESENIFLTTHTLHILNISHYSKTSYSESPHPSSTQKPI